MCLCSIGLAQQGISSPDSQCQPVGGGSGDEGAGMCGEGEGKHEHVWGGEGHVEWGVMCVGREKGRS